MLPGLKERLLGLINDTAYTPLKKEELALIFDIHHTEMPMFYNFLEELEEDGYIGKTKKGKIFYGCNNYPKCKEAYWDIPTGKLCPECKSMLTTKKDTVKCSSCDYQEN